MNSTLRDTINHKLNVKLAMNQYSPIELIIKNTKDRSRSTHSRWSHKFDNARVKVTFLYTTLSTQVVTHGFAMSMEVCSIRATSGITANFIKSQS